MSCQLHLVHQIHSTCRKIEVKMYLTLLVLLLTSHTLALEDNSITESIITTVVTIEPDIITDSITTSSTTSSTTPTLIPTSTPTVAPITAPMITPTTTAANTSITNQTITSNITISIKPSSLIPCTCGVFLSGQFKKGSKEQPQGNAALLHEQSEIYPCTNAGTKMCVNKCLDVIVKHLPNSPNILCGSIDRDCHKERAYLFVQNCKSEWVNTNLSAGREYCCKDGLPYKCPLMS